MSIVSPLKKKKKKHLMQHISPIFLIHSVQEVPAEGLKNHKDNGHCLNQSRACPGSVTNQPWSLGKVTSEF